LIFLSSADWMVRNLSYRIETAFPIYDPEIRKVLLDLIQIQFDDNIKARILDEQQSNTYHRNGSDLACRAQLETYYYMRRMG
jgi:polyphosphate kinase